MATQVFQKGAVFYLNNEKFCLSKAIEDGLWQVENLRTGRVVEIASQKLRDLYLKREIKFESQTLKNSIVNSARGKSLVEHEHYDIAKNRLLFVKKILHLPNTQQAVADQINLTLDQLPDGMKIPSAISVLRWKRLYIDSGKDLSSLIPKHALKGNTEERYTKDIVHIVDSVIDDIYMCDERKTIQDVIDEVYARVRITNQSRTKNNQLECPEKNFIDRKIREIPEFDRYAARYGYTAALHRFRSSKQVPTVEKPLERVEIDHTKLDLIVIDDDTGAVLGRPWLTVCIDVFSRSVLGIHIGFDSPSYLSVSYCLKHAFLPKTHDFSNVNKIKNTWVQYGVMRELVVDNGLEFHSQSLENTCLTLGIEIHYSARKTPWFKGKVERFFKELNNGVAHKVPGTTFSNTDSKGDYNSNKNAILRYSALQPLVNKWIVDVYHQRTHSALHVSPEKMWRDNISDDQIPLPDDLDFLEAALSKSAIRTLTHKGIEYDRIFYNSPALAALRRFKGSSFKVDIRVNDSDIAEIIVVSPITGELITAHAHCPGYASGTSRYQHKIVQNFVLKAKRKNESKEWLIAKHELSEMIKDEMAEGKKLKSRSRSARFKEHGLAEEPPMIEEMQTDLENQLVEDAFFHEGECDEITFNISERKSKKAKEEE